MDNVDTNIKAGLSRSAKATVSRTQQQAEKMSRMIVDFSGQQGLVPRFYGDYPYGTTQPQLSMTGTSGAGGAGGGGQGGVIIAVANAITGSGTWAVTGGSPGTHGTHGTAGTAGGSNGQDGNAGASGQSGIVYQITF